MATRKKVSKNPRIKLPAKWTNAQYRIGKNGQMEVRINPKDALGSGGRFAKCVRSVQAEGGAYDPRAVCAAQGRKKYGAKKMAKMAKAGKKRKR